MKDETNPNEMPIGLYHDPESGKFLGATDSNQAAAMARQGWKLFESGHEAAMTSQERLDSLQNEDPSSRVAVQAEVTPQKKGR